MIMAISVEPDSVLCHLWSLDHGKAITWENLSFVIWGWLTLLQPETGLGAHASLCTSIWTPCYPVYTLLSMRGSRIFRQGGAPGQSDKKSPDNVFFLVLSLFYWSRLVNFEENYHFSRFQRGSNIFQGGGPTFSRGVQLLIPYRNPYNLWFSRGFRTPWPPSGSALAISTSRR